MAGLRIIGGRARGRKLKAVPGDTTRPITDRTKESLFNIIGGDIEEASFLDLFAGTGSVGIEALSRGASYVRFIDVLRPAIETIKTNLEATGLREAQRLFKMMPFIFCRLPRIANSIMCILLLHNIKACGKKHLFYSIKILAG